MWRNLEDWSVDCDPNYKFPEIYRAGGKMGSVKTGSDLGAIQQFERNLLICTEYWSIQAD